LLSFTWLPSLNEILAFTETLGVSAYKVEILEPHMAWVSLRLEACQGPCFIGNDHSCVHKEGILRGGRRNTDNPASERHERDHVVDALEGMLRTVGVNANNIDCEEGRLL